MTTVKRFATAEDRWEGIGPYYAMFPIPFAKAVIDSYTDPGDSIVDPFAGRGTSVFAGAVNHRQSVGIEINPVGWIYARAKLQPASLEAVERRLAALVEESEGADTSGLPEFFEWCYSPAVQRFLVTARARLNWRQSPTDWTLAALLLVYLHGKEGYSLSNQMRQSKAMSPSYAVEWWRERKLSPPDIDVGEFLRPRIRWRYARGLPQAGNATFLLGDSRRLMSRVRSKVTTGTVKPFRLLFTSPPYLKITNYHYDQWLRLWMLGGRPDARRVEGPFRRKFEHPADYAALVRTVFSAVADLCAPSSTAYVRVDARQPTFDIVHDALLEAFPRHLLRTIEQPFARPTQTALFGDKSQKPGERDIILTR